MAWAPRQILPARSKLSRGHFAAMPYEEVPAFVAKLREQNSTAALALEFALLTAARTGEVIGSQWPEIDFHAKVWTIPAGRTKAGRTHRVPLSQRALVSLPRSILARPAISSFPGEDQSGHFQIWHLKCCCAGWRSSTRQFMASVLLSGIGQATKRTLPAKLRRPRSATLLAVM